MVQSPQTLLQPGRAPRPAGRVLQVPVLGRYRLLERLGSGGFGVVWRAHDELLHREVAVKRIALEPGTDGARASREALAGARLAHPAIVALYEACPEDDAFYLISELVHGQTLAELIAAGTLTDREVLQIGVALCDALCHAHARGVIHRDVKPQNVLVPDGASEGGPRGTAVGVAKLTDFGGARLAGEDVLTRTGDVLGTLAYMAPEQCEGHAVGEAGDLYSLALVLYEALSGRNPARGATPAETARRIGRPLPALRGSRRDLPRELTRSLDVALSQAPAERGTLTHLREALENALSQGAARGRSRAARRSEPLAQPDARAQETARPASTPDPRADAPTRAPTDAQARDARAGDEPTDARAPEARVRLPRALWLGGGCALAVWQAAAGRPGVALLVLAAVAPLLALPRRAGLGWLSCVLAPVLGLAGLAGAFLAIAGQARRLVDRAALGALGYWWLVLAEPLFARRLWLGEPSGTPARAVWEGSLTAAGAHVVGPLLSLTVLLGAALWAAGAAVLPWIVRGRRAALDAVAATMWAAALTVAATTLDSGLPAHPGPRGAVVGGVLAATLAVAARALRGPV